MHLLKNKIHTYFKNRHLFKKIKYTFISKFWREFFPCFCPNLASTGACFAIKDFQRNININIDININTNIDIIINTNVNININTFNNINIDIDININININIKINIIVTNQYQNQYNCDKFDPPNAVSINLQS